LAKLLPVLGLQVMPDKIGSLTVGLRQVLLAGKLKNGDTCGFGEGG
jgi:hypothetical protein